MKNNVEYELDYEVRKEIIKVREIIKQIVKDSQIYLFGSIAKGKYSKRSDIDILVLIKEDLTIKEVRKLRNHIEDVIEENRINRDVDVKLYLDKRFEELGKRISFEQAIKKDLIDIKEWENGK